MFGNKQPIRLQLAAARKFPRMGSCQLKVKYFHSLQLHYFTAELEAGHKLWNSGAKQKIVRIFSVF